MSGSATEGALTTPSLCWLGRLTVQTACAGTQTRPRTSVIQVTEPRSPCRKLAARFGRTDMAAMVQDTGFTGFLCRVLVCGDIGTGDALRMLRRDDHHDMTVAEAGRILNTDRGDLAGARRLYAVPALGYSARRRLSARAKPVAGLTDVVQDCSAWRVRSTARHRLPPSPHRLPRRLGLETVLLNSVEALANTCMLSTLTIRTHHQKVAQ